MSSRKERRDAVEHRKVILQQAQLLFAEHGVDNVSMHQIAKSAGVGQGTLYRRYAHKGELCLDLMQDNIRRIHEDIEKHLEAYKDRSIRERLEKVLQVWLEYVDQKSQALASIQAPSCAERRTLIYHSPLYVSLHELLRRLLEEAAVHNNKSDIDPVYMADAILAMSAPDLFLFIRHDRGYSTDKIWSNIQRLYIAPLFTD